MLFRACFKLLSNGGGKKKKDRYIRTPFEMLNVFYLYFTVRFWVKPLAVTLRNQLGFWGHRERDPQGPSSLRLCGMPKSWFYSAWKGFFFFFFCARRLSPARQIPAAERLLRVVWCSDLPTTIQGCVSFRKKAFAYPLFPSFSQKHLKRQSSGSLRLKNELSESLPPP